MSQQPNTPHRDEELDRIRGEFTQRHKSDPAFYSLQRPENLYAHQVRQRDLLRTLQSAGCLPLDDKRLLEVGCGSGTWLRMFIDLGVDATRLSAIDLNAESAALAQERAPGADIRVGNGADLPWPDATFDLTFQGTVFTSILDEELRRSVAAEMLRVTRPQGTLLWYDFHMDNPRNEAVKGVNARQIRELFPGCTIRRRRVTLAPPLSRRIAGRLPLVASVIESLRVLNTHYFASIRRSPP